MSKTYEKKLEYVTVHQSTKQDNNLSKFAFSMLVTAHEYFNNILKFKARILSRKMKDHIF